MALEKDMEIAPPPDAMATTGPAADAARAVILNVDDCEGIRYTRSRVLANAGYRVIEAGTGEEAMLLAGSLQPAVIVLDVQLPDVDGLDVCRKIKGDPHTTHIMVLQVSAVKSAALDRAAALDAGADAYLIEPIDPVELIATVKALLRLSAREAENRRLLTHLRLSAQSRGLPPDLEPAKTMAEQGRLLDLSHDAIVVRDAGDRIVYWSRGAEALYGWRQEEALGRKIHRLLHTEFPQALEEILAALHRDRYWSGELVHRTREGARITVMTRWIPDVDQQGRVAAVKELNTDITARKQTEASLLEQQRLLKSVTDNASVALFIMDERQHCVFMNPAAEALTGYTLQETRGRPLHDVVHHTRPDGSPYPLSECPIDRALPEENRMQGEEVFVHKDGRLYPVAFTASPIRNQADEPVGTIIEVQDISERKRAEEDLRASQESLRRLAADLERRVDERTQELVASQARLRGFATELNLAEQRERKRLAAELHDHLQQMLALGKIKLGQGKRLAFPLPACVNVMTQVEELLSDALTYTRTLVAELSPPVLRERGLAGALQWLGESMRKYDLAVTVTVPEDNGLKLPEDQTVLLFQSVRELLVNSWKHAGTGKASVTMDRQADRLRIEVRDEGAGFDLAAAAAANPSGGLSSKFGLFSIRERMRSLGGSFDIQSAPGKGTVATLVLPLGGNEALTGKALGIELQNEAKDAGAVSAVPQRSTLSDSKLRGAKIRVFLVDDHAMMREGLRAVLTGYDDVELVGEAGDGEEAVALVHRTRPEVVIMDINMPRMNGIEATAKIKLLYPHITVIGLSVNADGENQTAMLQAGAAILLTKEAAVERLYGAIRCTVSDPSQNA